eukprot:CAMPEP_0119518160 /NCGR_PEP_ID=MMETSP1344-20130328/34842_1 /TAXON_ID=236787 /ORGANISM="Florenciella parvula, Strain CCMP2471" /LENGTH=54 /DNA_ID=CAMNT_0007555811 /DNA_START=216 /DNA_END=377 /DNA_ORIENTATION=+
MRLELNSATVGSPADSVATATAAAAADADDTKATCVFRREGNAPSDPQATGTCV